MINIRSLALTIPALLCSLMLRSEPVCHYNAQLTELSPQAKAAGLGIWQQMHRELYQLLAKSTGCSISVLEMPWSRALQQLKNGQLDLTLTMSYTEERASYADFIGSHYQEQAVLILQREHATLVQQLSDLHKLKGQIGVMRNGYYGQAFEQARQQGLEQRLLQVSSVEQKLQLLEQGRVLGIVEDRAQYREWAKHNPVASARYQEQLLLHANPVYFAVSKSSVPQAQRDHLRQSWAAVYGSDAHLAILKKYGWTLQLN